VEDEQNHRVILDQGTQIGGEGEEEATSPDDTDPLFTAEELEGIEVTGTGKDFIEVQCGCTNNRYGDSAGKLKVYANGKLEISCDCYPGCNAGMPGRLLSSLFSFRILVR